MYLTIIGLPLFGAIIAGLLGRKVGDQVTVQTPGGEMKVKIIEIK